MLNIRERTFCKCMTRANRNVRRSRLMQCFPSRQPCSDFGHQRYVPVCTSFYLRFSRLYLLMLLGQIQLINYVRICMSFEQYFYHVVARYNNNIVLRNEHGQNGGTRHSALFHAVRRATALFRVTDVTIIDYSQFNSKSDPVLVRLRSVRCACECWFAAGCFPPKKGIHHLASCWTDTKALQKVSTQTRSSLSLPPSSRLPQPRHHFQPATGAKQF